MHRAGLSKSVSSLSWQNSSTNEANMMTAEAVRTLRWLQCPRDTLVKVHCYYAFFIDYSLLFLKLRYQMGNLCVL
jgi:hypothetical protein